MNLMHIDYNNTTTRHGKCPVFGAISNIKTSSKYVITPINTRHYADFDYLTVLPIRPRHRFFILRSLRDCASPDPRQAPTVRTHFFMASGVIFSLSLTSCPSGDFMVTVVQKPGFHFFFLGLYLYHPISHILLKMRAEKGEKVVALYQSHLSDKPSAMGN